jgi:type I restriction enzyme S subunit
MSFPRYPKYKASGVEWLGDVPEYWVIKPVRQLANVVNGFPFDSKLFDATEGIPLIRIRDLNQAETDTCYKGEFLERAAITSEDVLIGMDGDFNVGRWRGEGKALLNQRMCCIRGKSNLLTRLLEFSLPIPLKAINEATYATTVKHLASSQIEKTFVALPQNIEEQTAIVEFLDRETAKIDELVAEQRRLIELLKEKRQAVISHTVTKGLNPDAPMKFSGIEWLGEVPGHWKIPRLGYCASIENGTTPSRANPEYWSGGDIPWLSSGQVNQYKISEASEFITQKAINECSLRLLPLETIVIGMIGQGKTRGLAAYLEIKATINQNLAAIVPSKIIKSEYVLYIFQAVYGYLREFGRGGNQAALNCEQLSALKIPLPSPDEQLEICNFLHERLSEFDALTAEAQRAINLLQERRTALISAAVTGQIDVRKQTEN